MNNNSDTLFVTGYPGGMASHTVHAFLEREDIRIELLADDEFVEEALGEFAYASSRVNIVNGAIERIDFGLSGDAFHRLAGSIDSILHLELPPPPGSENSNGRSRFAAREVVELALAASELKHLIVLSHVDVCGNHVGKFAERDLELGQGFSDANQKDRFRAERIFSRFSSQLPITIIRSGWITGDGEGLCPFVPMLLSVDEVEQIPSKYPQAPAYFNDLESAVRLVVASCVNEGPLNGCTVHCIPSELPGVVEVARRFKSELQTLLPGGFNVSAGARRALKSNSERRKWVVKEFFKRQPGRAEICGVFSRSLMDGLGVPMPTYDDDWIHAMATRVAEEIAGFK